MSYRVSRSSIPFLSALLFLIFSTTATAQLFPGNTDEGQEEVSEEKIPEDPLGRSTPRGTVRGFISAVADRDYSQASEYLNLDGTSDSLDGEELAQTLQRLMDKGSLMAIGRISDAAGGVEDDNLEPGQDRVGTVSANGEIIHLVVEMTEGPQGIPVWLFSAETVERIADVSVEDGLLINRILPPFLRDTLWGGAPAGHWLAVLVLMVLAYILAWSLTHIIRFLIRSFWEGSRVDPAAGVIKALALPIGLYVSVWLFVLLSQEVGISIIIRQRFSALTIIVGVIALLIFLWRLSAFIGNFSKKRMLDSQNASGVSIVIFLQRAAKVAIIVIGFIIILGTFGVDVTAGIAALGIGGIALALGAQKSVENFVGSVTLIADRPIRVGDFCKVGDIVGTVESIGMRSTRIRTLARTIVTIPNGEFSSAKIENFAHRDRFWFHPFLNLRYETTPDQIRYLLVEIREVLYAHPKVSPGPRIRFIELGSASLDMEIFAYISAADYDEFLEVQEDLLLRIMDIVEESGTGFAFPSQTIYFARDSGLSEEKSEAAREQVRKWRENDEMQLPGFDPDRIEALKDTIAYPPEGSVQRKEKE